MTEDIKHDEVLQKKVESFLNLNYPCRCGSSDCPGNYFEAQAIVQMIKEDN